MIELLLAGTAGVGTYLVYSANVVDRLERSEGVIERMKQRYSGRFNDWTTQAGIAPDDRRRAAATVIAAFAIGTLFGWLLFGGVFAPPIVGIFAGTFPLATYRQRRHRRRSEAADAWPRMIEEIRLLCGSLGRPIPQALLEVGKHGPPETQTAFREAEREWLISTDFGRTVAVLKQQLADPTADVICETLLIAHEIGGSDVDRRLAALAEDRQMDLHGRKDARAKQSGVKFARRFVLVVPLGMAMAGLSIGDGRDAYATAEGQLGVAAGLLTLAGCWWWSGRLIRLPKERRVFRA